MFRERCFDPSIEVNGSPAASSSNCPTASEGFSSLSQPTISGGSSQGGGDDQNFWFGFRAQLDDAQQVPDEAREHPCDNCGKFGKVERCKRCRQAYFCSPKCRQEYEPFHQRWCKQNDFADAMEDRDPEFAKWLRTHGRQAILTDRDVGRMQDRSNWDVSEFYGKATRQPIVSQFTEEEMHRARAREEAEKAAKLKRTPFQKAWDGFAIPPGLGGECTKYKWKQSLANVYVLLKLPSMEGGQKRRVAVTFKVDRVTVLVNGNVFLQGIPQREIVPEACTWEVDQEADAVEIMMLKLWRKDNYKTGETNAETWWRRVFAEDPDPHRQGGEWDELHEAAAIPLDKPPSEYYSAPMAY